SGEPIWIEFIKTREQMPGKGLKFFTRSDSIHIPFFESEFALLTTNNRDSLFIRENFAVPPEVPIFEGLRTLLNVGITLSLLDYDDNIYENFDYKQQFSPLKAISAERISPFLLPTDQNWTACLTTATPGKKNSVQMNVVPTTSVLSIENSPFSPYKNEHCFIKVSVQHQQVIADVIIFDLKGREVIRLADKATIPGEYAFIWDGKDSHRKNVLPGVYPLYIKVQTARGTVVMDQQKQIVIGR
ncbi:MAG: hypothetical protein FWG20_02615, partial [Candidatus Cloacimonetes bacterium]|nr:hypothetical protein [Candidatus Cloacimonadota bacterium]